MKNKWIIIALIINTFIAFNISHKYFDSHRDRKVELQEPLTKLLK